VSWKASRGLARNELRLKIPQDPGEYLKLLIWARERGFTIFGFGPHATGHYPRQCRNGHRISGLHDEYIQPTRPTERRCRFCMAEGHERKKLRDRLKKQKQAA
jgi:hypothetical protein